MPEGGNLEKEELMRIARLRGCTTTQVAASLFRRRSWQTCCGDAVATRERATSEEKTLLIDTGEKTTSASDVGEAEGIELRRCSTKRTSQRLGRSLRARHQG